MSLAFRSRMTTTTTSTSDLLAAASLLLTLITFVYGLLYPELSAVRAITLGGRQVDDVGPDRRRVREARGRAIGLATAAAVVGAVFAPPAANLAWHFLSRLPKGRAAFFHYDAVAVTLVLVTAGFFLLAMHAMKMAQALNRTLAGLRGAAA
jgi:hypothetical protein